LRHGVLVSVTIRLRSVAACLSCDVRSRDGRKHLQISMRRARPILISTVDSLPYS